MLPILPALLAILLGGFGDADRTSLPAATPHLALAVIAHYWAESTAVAEVRECAAAPTIRPARRSSVIVTYAMPPVRSIPAGFVTSSRPRDGP
jgi:hypothetical protein